MVPAIEGRDVLEGGAMDVLGPLAGGSIGCRAVLVGVPVLEELADDTVEPSCLVGDLLGDCESISQDISSTSKSKEAYCQSRHPSRPCSRCGAPGIYALPFVRLGV